MPKEQIRGPYQSPFIQESTQPMMQASAPVRAMYGIQNGQMPIRGAYPSGPRMHNPNFVQMPQEFHQQYVPQGYQVYNQAPHYQQYPQIYPNQTGYNQQMYVVQRPANPQNFVVHTQQSIPTQNPPPNMQQTRPQIFLPSQQIHHMPQQQQQQQQPHQDVQPKKRATIKLVDPNTGKDLTSEVFKKKEKTPPAPRASSAVKITPPPQPAVSSNEEKLKANANFAAKVAALQNVPKKPDTEESSSNQENNDVSKETVSIENKENIDTKNTKIDLPTDKAPDVIDHPPESSTSDSNVEPIKQTHSQTTETDLSIAESKTTDGNKLLESEIVLSNKPTDNVTVESVVDASTESTVDVSTESSIDLSTEPSGNVPEEISKDETEVIPKDVHLTEVKPEQTSDLDEGETDPRTSSNSQLLNGFDENSKSAFAVTKKKNKKQRFKDIDAKQDSNNSDLLSAFIDAPKKEEVPKEEPAPPPQVKDATWEDKEKTIDKEVIRNENAEEPEAIPVQQPRVEQTTIVSNEDGVEDDDEKLQYDRDFLLKFQFAPICTSKPANLPNIDIVLDQAHQPTKPLVPGQRINNFMPDYMRQASGGRSSGGGRSKDRRGPPSMGGNRPQKIIQVPQFEKIELKKSENAWVRPSELAKEMTDEDRERDELTRNVRSILNKLTPQKFKTLVDQMTSLKIDTKEKLEMSIGIIFEKAISEPGFSVAYANMCRVLTEVFKTMPGDKNINFRKILLNKCQKEFEKEKQDDLQMEEDRNKTFDTEKEKKEWLEELDYRELKNRRRTLGNIRFIGELFKLKMISEKIMHECILKLLRTNKPESMEDNLECLCKLLSTIGKDLDHQEAKPRIDQYFQQIQKIIEKRKISSRIKFALKDVIDLRASNWVPRRDEGNPKTIDQIHREAQRKEKEEELARQQEKLKRSDPRSRMGGGGGGRDSPSVRPSTSADGWTNVPSKTARSFGHTPVDASKFKIKKNETGDISLGPGGRPGAWSRGASGGSSSRSGSGSNTPTNEIEQPKANRFDLLSGSDAPLDPRRSSRPNSAMRKGSQGTPTSSRRADERSAALRAVRDATGQSSRNQSPVRSADSSQNSPISGAQTPVESNSLSPNPPAVDEDKMRKVTKSTVEEFFGVKDYKEATLCIKELESPQLHWAFIEEVVVIATEKKKDDRINSGKLINFMVKQNIVKLQELLQGLTSLIEVAPDIAVDVPLFYKYLGEILGPLIAEPSVLPLKDLKDVLQPLVNLNKAGIVMAEALNTASLHISSEEEVNAIWSKSGFTWDQFLDKGVVVDEFIENNKVGYTVKPIPKQSHASEVQGELLRLLKEKTDNKQVIEFIEGSFSTEEKASDEFIHSLTDSVCRSVVKDGESCTCQKDLLRSRKNILLRYIGGNKKLELQATYALQNLATSFNHPRALLTAFFEELYDCDIISEETFEAWETSKEFPDGKGVALSEVKGFLQWLKKAEEEQNEEDAAPAKIGSVQ